MNETEALEALTEVVRTLREDHKACVSTGGCPWPLMWDSDVVALLEALSDSGVRLTR